MSDLAEFEFDSYQDTESIQKYLESLVEGFENHRIMLSSDKKEITLYPEDLLQFSIKAKKKDGENKLNIKISWKDKGKSKSKKTISIGS
ncbi:MAG: amphi-Trp domain-containing protein [Desulfobacterales bacterium]|nr:amphi-Trp domain-containing protein [Desulfobacterales bacterium]